MGFFFYKNKYSAPYNIPIPKNLRSTPPTTTRQNGGHRNRTCRSCKTSLSKVEEENKIMKKSIKAIIAATFTAALLAGCSSNTASTTTAAETTTATQRQQRLNPQTQQIQLLQTVPTPSASTSSQSTALSTTAAKASSRGLQRTVSLKERTLPY